MKKMLKIKDEVDLLELIYIGFYLEGNTYKYDLPLGKCAYICANQQANREVIIPCYNLKWYQFIFKKKIINEILDLKTALFVNDLVEVVE